MLVRVYAPAFCNHDLIDRKGFVEVEEGTTLLQLLKKLEMPFVCRNLPIVFVNDDRAKKSTKLKEGDVVSIMGPVSSG